MRNDLIDWTTNTINFLIFIYIFIKTLGSSCFDLFDISVSLFGVSAGVLGFIVGLINRSQR